MGDTAQLPDRQLCQKGQGALDVAFYYMSNVRHIVCWLGDPAVRAGSLSMGFQQVCAISGADFRRASSAVDAFLMSEAGVWPV